PSGPDTAPAGGDEAVGGASVAVEIVTDIATLPAADWDACAAPETADGGPAANPFITHAFLAALEAGVGDEGVRRRPAIRRLGRSAGVPVARRDGRDVGHDLDRDARAAYGLVAARRGGIGSGRRGGGAAFAHAP
ncbi:MAG: hypothetical protein AAFV86_19850, partial [Pseudomonadota bacterium]